MQNVLLVIHIVVTLLLIFIVLVQEGKDPGMRGIQGASSDMGDLSSRATAAQQKKRCTSNSQQHLLFCSL